MAKIINLNLARKARDKDNRKTRAAENVARFGRSKAQKQADATKAAQDRKTVDDHEIE